MNSPDCRLNECIKTEHLFSTSKNRRKEDHIARSSTQMSILCGFYGPISSSKAPNQLWSLVWPRLGHRLDKGRIESNGKPHYNVRLPPAVSSKCLGAKQLDEGLTVNETRTGNRQRMFFFCAMCIRCVDIHFVPRFTFIFAIHLDLCRLTNRVIPVQSCIPENKVLSRLSQERIHTSLSWHQYKNPSQRPRLICMDNWGKILKKLPINPT